MKTNKILFLDVDGVLNSMNTIPSNEIGKIIGIHKKQLEQLFRIVQETDVDIVMSSTWRLYEHLRKDLKDAGVNFIDCTPCLRRPITAGSEYCERGKEIKDWLDRHPEVEKYAIVDDDNDMLPEQQSKFFKTSFMKGGLTEDIADEIISYFNCKHECTSNCRREGCNCDCGEYHV